MLSCITLVSYTIDGLEIVRSEEITTNKIPLHFNQCQGLNRSVLRKAHIIANLRIANLHYPFFLGYFRYLNETAFLPENGGRPSVSHIGILLTDGNSHSPALSIKYADMAKASGITIFGIAIGRNIRISEIKNISSGADYVFNVTSFSGLDSIKHALLHKTCQGKFTSPSLLHGLSSDVTKGQFGVWLFFTFSVILWLRRD